MANLYFAGEHYSTDFQGFTNGGAETGRRAAQALLVALGKTRAALTHIRQKSRETIASISAVETQL